MSKFADDTKLCHRAKNPDDIMELQEDNNKLVEWANKWQMSYNNIFYWNKITKYNWHSNKNTDGLVNRLESNLVLLIQAHRVAWLIGQSRY